VLTKLDAGTTMKIGTGKVHIGATLFPWNLPLWERFQII